MRRAARPRHAAVLLAAVVLGLSGCASVTSGTGTTGSAPRSASASSSPSVGASPSPSLAVPSSASPSTGSSTAAGTACPSGADYCDDFSKASSGWPVENRANYYANYDRYLSGTYRMGERTANAKTELAPFDTTTVSADYGVRLDVDAVLGESAPASSFIGLVCWDHETSAKGEAGFFFFVTAASVDVTLLSDAGGEPHTLTRNAGSQFIRPFPAANHLTATCTQGRASGGTQAELTLAINGATVLRTTYADSVKNFSWSPGAKAGLLVGGKSSDVFYDNFAITAT